MDKLSELDEVVTQYRSQEEEVEEMFEGLEDTTNACNRKRIEINNNIDSIVRNSNDECNEDDDYDMGF